MTIPRARARPAALLAATAAATAVAIAFLGPAPAAAAELSLFQHGGRGLAQALDVGYAVAAGVVAVDPRDEYSERIQF